MTEQGFLQQLGNYKLVRVIGQGGFATVYLGRHVHLRSYAAVKVLKVATEADVFIKEARTIMNLAHPNIIRVLDFDVQDEITFIVMDYAPYGSLQLQYRLGTIVPIDGVLSYVKQAAAALQYAHNHRIIHRDVKPSNLLVGKQYTILLSDFGIALPAESSRNTRTRDAAGTVAYIAPEQIKGKPRPASDQYALAVSAYEWLCGRRPFRGTLGEITAQHLSSPPPPLRSYNPSISRDVEEVVLQALTKDPTQRFPNIQEFADALENAAGVRPRLASYESFTTQNMVKAAPATVVLPASERSNASLPGMLTQHDGRSNRDLASVGTIVGEEPAAGRSRASARQQRPSKPSLLSRRTILLTFSAIGVSSIAGLAFAALQHGSLQPTSQTLVVSPHQTGTPSQHPPTTTATATPTTGATPQPTPKPTQPPQPTPKPTQPSIQAGTLFSIYQGHTDFVVSVAWSPDGTRIVSGAADKTAQIWHAADGGSVLTYTGHTLIVNHVDWSPDGRRIASASNDMTVQVWDAITGGLLFKCIGHTNHVQCVAWSPDGKRIVSGSGDNTVKVWDATTGNLLTTYRDHAATVWTVAWSPDGKQVASAAGNQTLADNTVKVWNTATGTTTITYTGHANSVLSAAWSPDGKRIASASNDTTVQVWDAVTGATQLTYRGHNDSALSVAWSPNGTRIASGSLDTTVAIWDVTTNTTHFTYHGHTSTTFGVAWSPDGTRVASASVDKTVQVWQA